MCEEDVSLYGQYGECRFLRVLEAGEGNNTADAALARKNDSYRKVIYMKHEKKIILLKIKKLLEQQIAGTDNWNDIFIQFDYNPLQAY